MSAATQLPLEHPAADVAFDATRFYRVYADSGKAPASQKASIAIGIFVGTFLAKPAACFCHPEDAAAISEWSLDVPVLAGPVPRHQFHVGPVPGLEAQHG